MSKNKEFYKAYKIIKKYIDKVLLNVKRERNPDDKLVTSYCYTLYHNLECELENLLCYDSSEYIVTITYKDFCSLVLEEFQKKVNGGVKILCAGEDGVVEVEDIQFTINWTVESENE